MTCLFRVFENNSLKIGDKSVLTHGSNAVFLQKHFDSLVKYNEKYKNKFFIVGHKKITFSQYVGLIQVGNISIEVLPKIGNTITDNNEPEKLYKALIDLLRFCKHLKIHSSEHANIKLHQATILDLFIEMFLTEFQQIIHKGLQKKYLITQKNLSTVRGKIMFSLHIKNNTIHKEKTYCEFSTYDYDHKINQILYKALQITKQIDINKRYSDKIMTIECSLPNISMKDFSKKDFDNISLNRTDEKYRDALKLAELIILNFSQGLYSGKDNVFALLFDMNSLYEEFVYKLLKKEYLDSGFIIKGQISKYFWERKTIRPDILIQNKNTKQNSLIVDTKWKMPLNNIPADDDLKQMYVYNKYYGVKHSVLLYPSLLIEDGYQGKYRDEENHKNQSDYSCAVRKLQFEFTTHNRLDFDKTSANLRSIIEKISNP